MLKDIKPFVNIMAGGDFVGWNNKQNCKCDGWFNSRADTEVKECAGYKSQRAIRTEEWGQHRLE